MVYLEDEINDFHREDFYAAQIAATIARGYAKYQGRVHTKDFILDFSGEKKSSSPEESKKFWMGALGMKDKEEDTTISIEFLGGKTVLKKSTGKEEK